MKEIKKLRHIVLLSSLKERDAKIILDQHNMDYCIKSDDPDVYPTLYWYDTDNGYRKMAMALGFTSV